MGFWDQNGLTIGDGPLDAAHEFLVTCAAEYEEAFGRKPSLDEVLTTLKAVLYKNAEQYVSDGQEIYVISLKAETAKRPKKQPVRPGDVIAIPLKDGTFAVGRLSPQARYMVVYDVKTRRIPRIADVANRRLIRLSYLISEEPIEDWTWRIVGNIPFEDNEFQLQHFIIAKSISCGTGDVRDKEGFILVDSSTRPASEDERKTLPKLSIWGEREVVADIMHRLEKSPIV